MRRPLNLLFAVLTTGQFNAQAPDTELWLFRISAAKEGTAIGKGENITNRPGYDNQPVFSSNSKKIWYTSQREDKQTDVYVYDIKSGKSKPCTKTQVSEYSPQPFGDGKLLASVTVEADSSQCIHYINAENGIHESKLPMDSVGYYTFLNNDTVIYYKLTEPHSLRFYVHSSGEDQWLGDSPTRAFRTPDRHTLLYALKDSSHTVFYKYNFLLHRGERWCDYPSLNEDFILHPKFGLVKSEGTKLLRYDETSKEWQLLFDTSSAGLKRITRFDIDPKGKYLVVTDNLQ